MRKRLGMLGVVSMMLVSLPLTATPASAADNAFDVWIDGTRGLVIQARARGAVISTTQSHLVLECTATVLGVAAAVEISSCYSTSSAGGTVAGPNSRLPGNQTASGDQGVVNSGTLETCVTATAFWGGVDPPDPTTRKSCEPIEEWDGST